MYMRQFLILTSLLGILLINNSALAQSIKIECKINKVFSYEYEEVNDFTFEDYPSLTIKSVAGGWYVGIGAMIYGDETSETEPSQIKKTQANTSEIVIRNTNPNESWIVRLNLQTKIAIFSTQSQNETEKFIDVALFSCN
jgi:hypothetical protein